MFFKINEKDSSYITMPYVLPEIFEFNLKPNYKYNIGYNDFVKKSELSSNSDEFLTLMRKEVIEKLALSSEYRKKDYQIFFNYPYEYVIKAITKSRTDSDFKPFIGSMPKRDKCFDMVFMKNGVIHTVVKFKIFKGPEEEEYQNCLKTLGSDNKIEKLIYGEDFPSFFKENGVKTDYVLASLCGVFSDEEDPYIKVIIKDDTYNLLVEKLINKNISGLKIDSGLIQLENLDVSTKFLIDENVLTSHNCKNKNEKGCNYDDCFITEFGQWLGLIYGNLPRFNDFETGFDVKIYALKSSFIAAADRMLKINLKTKGEGEKYE